MKRQTKLSVVGGVVTLVAASGVVLATDAGAAPVGAGVSVAAFRTGGVVSGPCAEAGETTTSAAVTAAAVASKRCNPLSPPRTLFRPACQLNSRQAAVSTLSARLGARQPEFGPVAR